MDAVVKEVKDGGWRDDAPLHCRRVAGRHAGGRPARPRPARPDRAVRRPLPQGQGRRPATGFLRPGAVRARASSATPPSPASNPSPTARAYHRLFRHVLVDEYQDINELQDAIIGLLSHECLWGNAEWRMQNAESKTGKPEARSQKPESRKRPHSALGTQHGSTARLSSPKSELAEVPALLPPNLFCVGDVKQSIYRFRLAEPQRFLQREQAFRAAGERQHGQVIDLQANFRSRGAAARRDQRGLRAADDPRGGGDPVRPDPPARPGQGVPAGQAGTGGPCFTGAPIELHVLPSKFGSAAAAATPIRRDGAADADDFELDRAEREAVLVARRIHEMMGQSAGCPRMQVLDRDGQTYRPIRYRDIVLLLRSMQLQGRPVRRRAAAGRRPGPRRERDRVLRVDRSAGHARAAGGARQPAAGHPAGRRAPQPDRAAPEPRKTASPASASPTPPRERPVPFHQAVVRYAAERDDELAAFLRELPPQAARLAGRRPPPAAGGDDLVDLRADRLPRVRRRA